MTAEIRLQDVLDYGQLTLGGGASATAMSAIFTSAMADLEAWFRRPVGIREFTDRIRYDGYEDFITFPNTPLVDLLQVSADGVDYPVVQFDTASFGLDNMAYGWLSPGLQTRFVVRYTAGIDLDRYKGLGGVICRTVLDEFYARNPALQAQSHGGAVSRFATDGGYSVDFRDPSGSSSSGGVQNPDAAAFGIFKHGALLAYAHLRRRIL